MPEPPASTIPVSYTHLDLDEAAKRVLNELTGLKNVKLTQFKAYGSKNRTRNPKDVLWLEPVSYTHLYSGCPRVDKFAGVVKTVIVHGDDG